MAQQNIGPGRLEQRTSGAKLNANFNELYGRETEIALTATANTTFSIPAGYMIAHVAFQNTTANAVTGGIKLGTTSGGTEIVTAQAVAANAIDSIPGASFTKRIFSTSAATPVYVQAITAWNSASVKLSIVLRKMF